MKKHARFLQIERGSQDEAPRSESADRARIAAVLEATERAGRPGEKRLEVDRSAPAGDGSAPEWPERTTSLPDASEVPREADSIQLDMARAEGQPFVRCARCGADESLHAAKCGNCGAELDTPAQRAFNDRVWETHQRHKQRESEALSQMNAARQEQAERALRPLPEPGVAKPPDELLEGPSQGSYLGALLSHFESPRAKLRVLGGLVALPLALILAGRPALSWAGRMMLFLLVLTLLPRSVGHKLRDVWARLRDRG